MQLHTFPTPLRSFAFIGLNKTYVPQNVLYGHVAVGGSFLYSSYPKLSVYGFDNAFKSMFITL